MTRTELAGQVCLVTGGARGIGLAIARELCSRGADVAIVDVLDPDAAVRTLQEQGIRAAGWQADVRDRGQVRHCVDGVVGRFGRIDVLVNNAGTCGRIDLEHMDDATWERDIATNLTGTFLFTQAAIYPHMKAQGSGRIVNISSVSGIMGGLDASGESGGRSGPAYAASKGGIIAFTRWVAKEVGTLGITSNTVAPGAVATPMTDKMDYPLGGQAIKRMGRPEDIAAAVAYLAGPGTSFVTGETLKVCGGAAIG